MSTPHVAAAVESVPPGKAADESPVATAPRRVRVPITVKVIVSHVVIAALSTIVIAWTLISYFTQDKTTYVRDLGTYISTNAARSAGLMLRPYDDQVRRLAERLEAGDAPPEVLRSLLLEMDQCVYAAIYADSNEKILSMLKGRQLRDWGLDVDQFGDDRNTLKLSLAYVKTHKSMFVNTTTSSAVPTFSVLRYARSTHLQRDVIVYGEFMAAPLLELVDQTSGFSTYIVDNFGGIFAHRSPEVMLAHELPGRSELTTALLGRAGTTKSVSTDLELADGTVSLFSFAFVELGDLGVVAERSKEDAYKAARQVTRQSIVAAIAVVALAVVVSVVFSRALTGRLVELSSSAERLQKGDFDVYVEPRANDELGDLATSFNLAAIGLKERAELDAKMRKGMLGQLAAISPVGLVQTLNCWRLTGVLVVDSDDQEGRISFEVGEVNGAATETLASSAAFMEMMTWSTGGFFFEPGPTAPSDETRIEGDTMGLIMEAMQRIDEASEAMAEAS